MFAEVVDISAALSNQTRILYPKVAKKGQVLDDFLQRRLQLKTLEERRIELKLGKGNVFFFMTDRVPDFGQDLNKAYLSSFFANFLVHISVKLYSGVLFKLLNEKYIYILF